MTEPEENHEKPVLAKAAEIRKRKFFETLRWSWFDLVQNNIFTFTELTTNVRLRHFYAAWRIAEKRKWFDS